MFKGSSLQTIANENFAANLQPALDVIYQVISSPAVENVNCYSVIIPKIIKSGFENGREPIKKKVNMILNECVYQDQTNEVLQDLFPNAKMKTPKVIASCLKSVTELLRYECIEFSLI